MQRHTFPKKAVAAIAVVLAAVLGVAGVASAHVSVTPSSAEQGSCTALTFRVPNEKDDASTVGVTITMSFRWPVPCHGSLTMKASPSFILVIGTLSSTYFVLIAIEFTWPGVPVTACASIRPWVS